VHHVNEIAQSEAAFGHKWVNYWLHNEFVVIGDDDKMSKSKGNIIRIQNLMDEGFSPMEYRYFLLQTHYRKRVPFTLENLGHAQNAFKRLRNRILELEKEGEKDDSGYMSWLGKFTVAINDDLNTPKCFAVLHEMLDDKNMNDITKRMLVEKFDEVLGLNLLEESALPAEILKLKEERDLARKSKDFKKSDELRDVLKQKGYEVLDDKEGSTVRKI